MGMALNALGWEGNAKQMDLFAADPYGAMELRTNTTAKTITAHVGEDNVEAMEKPLPRFYLLLLTWNLYTINNNRGQSDIEGFIQRLLWSSNNHHCDPNTNSCNCLCAETYLVF